ncbi:MAG: hypothetical protein FJ356_00760 [Thaumarchaeota archaeon]|nr:hypothetical protein [Nitrososphaerota archaeon]
MDTKLAVIFAIPGRRKETRYFLEKYLSNAKFHDITNQMLANLPPKTTTKQLATRPRNYLKKEWELVVKRIIDSIKADSDLQGKLNVLIDHSVFFNGTTREFFPLFNAAFLQNKLSNNISVSHVVQIIDDVFDSFNDLSNVGELFSRRPIRTFLKLYAKSLGVSSYTNFNNDPKADANWISHTIQSLLNWRAKEMILSQSIAAQLDAKFLLWGVKQDLEVLCKFIKEDKKIFYISHPISEPRSKVKKPDDWPSLTHVINSLQLNLKSHDLLTIMPTSIDEYRLDKDNAHNYTGKLKLRWPTPTHVKSSLCESPNSLINDDVDKIDVIHPTEIELVTRKDIKREKLADVTKIQEFLNGVYGALDMRIEYELGNRDHLLVWSTAGIIVIEPFKIDKGDISGGVEMELMYLENVNDAIKMVKPDATLNELRKICAVFSKESIHKILQQTSYKEKLIPKLRLLVKTKYTLNEKIADSVISINGTVIDDPTSLGDTTLDVVAEDLQKNIEQYRNQVIIAQFLVSTLAVDPSNKEHVAVLILDKLEHLTDSQNVCKMKDFLINSQPFSWESDILEIAKSVKVFEK